MINLDKYKAVRWEMGGRIYPVLDCYGIVHEVRRDLGLPVWGMFEGVVNEGDLMGRKCEEERENLEQCEPCPGAVAACYRAGMINHLGVVISIDGLFHVMESNPFKNVTILPLQRFKRRYPRVEFYR